MLPVVGTAGLLIALLATVVSVALLAVGEVLRRRASARGEMLRRFGRWGALACALALLCCCSLLVWCFMVGDTSLNYVLRNQSDASGDFAWLFRLSGLWAGRSGSLLFWAFLISLFDAFVAFGSRKRDSALDGVALVVSQLVLLAFLLVLAFSPGNMPFVPTDGAYLNPDGSLTQEGSLLGMNVLLEHWAMAVHPPTLFIGYAGLTIPFAYAIGALVVNDDSDAWVLRSSPYLMVSWLFLTIGVGLGAVWAYVVLGWGGYWGWDPVENASLLPWLVCVALIHSFTIYRKRGELKRWSIMCACLAFSFVILGTFIARSGLVQSVHAFEGDNVSLVLFLVLIVASVLAGALGLLLRRGSFGAGGERSQDIDSLASKDAAYYLNNLFMVAAAVLLAYMTVAAALPGFLPLGGQSLSASTYNSIARPVVILYCALIAICPLLGWGKTQGRVFARRSLVPGLCALALFVLLMIFFATTLLPSYQFMVAMGGSGAASLLEQGPALYYNGLAVAGFAVASVLVFNSAFMLAQAMRGRSSGNEGDGAVGGSGLRKRLAGVAGGLCHGAMGVLLIGLIGSSMYVTELTGTMAYDEESDSCDAPFVIGDYELTYAGRSIQDTDSGNDALYSVFFDVTRNGQPVGSVAPAIQAVKASQQQKLVASVLGFPDQDLFVAFRGLGEDGGYVMDVRINPLISLVWLGYGLMIAGAVASVLARRAGTRGKRGA